MRVLRESRWVKLIYWAAVFIAFAAIALSAVNGTVAGRGSMPYQTVVGLHAYPVGTLVTLGVLVTVVLAGILISHLLRRRSARTLELEIRRMSKKGVATMAPNNSFKPTPLRGAA